MPRGKDRKGGLLSCFLKESSLSESRKEYNYKMSWAERLMQDLAWRMHLFSTILRTKLAQSARPRVLISERATTKMHRDASQGC